MTSRRKLRFLKSRTIELKYNASEDAKVYLRDWALLEGCLGFSLNTERKETEGPSQIPWSHSCRADTWTRADSLF